MYELRRAKKNPSAMLGISKIGHLLKISEKFFSSGSGHLSTIPL